MKNLKPGSDNQAANLKLWLDGFDNTNTFSTAWLSKLVGNSLAKSWLNVKHSVMSLVSAIATLRVHSS